MAKVNDSREVVERLEKWKEVRPWVRTGMAFIIYLVRPPVSRDCYASADYFLHQLEKDLEEDTGEMEE
jgi:hypothetical protein